MDSIIVIIIAIIFSAFFSGMEIAFVASNRLLVELDHKQKVIGSKLTSLFIHNPGQYITTMLVGNNISLVIYGIVFARLLSPYLMSLTGSEFSTLVIQTLISTLVILVLAESLPKNIFLRSPNSFLRTLSLPLAILYFLLYPIAKISLRISQLFIRVFTGKKTGSSKNKDHVFNRSEFNHFVNFVSNDIDDEKDESGDMKIFRNALEFSNVKLRECMVPRTEIEALDINDPIAELKQKFIKTGYSKILIFDDSIDNIVGYFELKDLYKKPENIRSCLRKLSIVPETMAANKLLKLFVEEKRNVALVVDEFGGTSGMVTIEDVLEEIVGEIEDEHDTTEFTEKVTAPGEFVFSGRLDIDYLNEEYNLNLPEMDDYETLAGLVLYHHGSIPRAGEIIRIGPNEIKVLKVSPTKLELVSLKINS